VQQSYPLAPMSPLIRGLTWFVLLLPVCFVALALSNPRAILLLNMVLFLLVIYGSVWTLWRPKRFEITPNGLLIAFPLRTKLTPLDSIVSVRAMSKRDKRAELGRAMRVGAGGLWGGFGWLSTQKRGWVEFYISRLDDYVFIERRGKAPLLITPARPEAFIAELDQRRR